VLLQEKKKKRKSARQKTAYLSGFVDEKERNILMIIKFSQRNQSDKFLCGVIFKRQSKLNIFY
jgi:hypothetical protein